VGPARQRAEKGSGERGQRAGEKWAGERSVRPHGGKGRGEKREATVGPLRGRKGRWAGPAGLGHKEKKKGKKKKKSGLAQPGIRGEKDKCFSNAFEFELKFKFKWKTINKTMQRA
jgi:hypothetical protein